jgi:hypothetical protein
MTTEVFSASDIQKIITYRLHHLGDRAVISPGMVSEANLNRIIARGMPSARTNSLTGGALSYRADSGDSKGSWWAKGQCRVLTPPRRRAFRDGEPQAALPDRSESRTAAIAQPDAMKSLKYRAGRSVHLGVDMQRIFSAEGPWSTPWMDMVLPIVADLANHHPGRTVFTRFIPPERPEQMPGMWQRYCTRWRVTTRECLDLQLLELMPVLAALCPRPLSSIKHAIRLSPGPGCSHICGSVRQMP